MLDTRYLAVTAVIIAFMLVTVGHVANYAGSFETVGWRWLGLPYAIAVDAAIVICAWLTRWETTRRTAFLGYSLFAIMSGAMNFAAVKPWTHPWPEYIFVSIYALFPTCAIVLLGFLARDTEKAAERGKPRGLLARWSNQVASKIVSTKATIVDTSAQQAQIIDTSGQVPMKWNLAQTSDRYADDQPSLHHKWTLEEAAQKIYHTSTDKVRVLHEKQPDLTPTQLAQQVGCSVSTASRALNKNGDKHE